MVSAVIPRASRRVGLSLTLYFAVDAAGALHLAYAWHGKQRPGYIVVHHPAELSSRQFVRLDCIGNEGTTDKVDALDDRLFDTLGQILSDFGDGVAHVVNGSVGAWCPG